MCSTFDKFMRRRDRIGKCVCASCALGRAEKKRGRPPGLPDGTAILEPYFAAIDSHFFMKEVLAAPDSGLPSLLTALVSQLAAALAPPSHFLMKEVFAAPLNGLPDFETACASQLAAAGAVVGAVAGAVVGAVACA